MTESSRTFSDVWYRVARQTVTLRPRVEVRRQVFRGEPWHVLYDPFNNQFFRVRPEAYAFIARLRPDRTVEDDWQETLDDDPDGAPGQEDVIQLLAQLYHANLLHYKVAADSEQFFARYRKRKQRERLFTWSNLMFARFPLLDPDAALNRAEPVLRWLFRPWAAVVWCGVVGWALKTCIDHAAELGAASGNVLAASNLVWLYLGIVVVKSLHELGHAAACKHFGGEVHTLGLMLLFFSPLPYVDVTSSWAFRERWRRIAVASAGVVAELFVAGLAALFWASAGPGFWRDLAFDMMIAAGVTTVLFNANPLLRYDGYYVLSDLIDLPNLYQRAQQMLHFLAEKHLFGVRGAPAVADAPRERRWLTTYGVLSLVYRVFVFTGIVWVISGRFLIVGALIAVFCAVAWGIVPLIRFGHYLVANPRLERTRGRALGVTAGLALAAVVVLFLIPAPERLQATGVVQSTAFAEVSIGVDGQLEKLEIPDGSNVVAGQPLARLRNGELVHQIAAARAQLEELEALWRAGLHQGSRTRVALEEGIAAVRARVQDLEERQTKLVVTAPISGRWVGPREDELMGRWLTRGTALGSVVGAAGFEFLAVVPQADSSRLFAHETTASHATVRLHGQADAALPISRLVVIPAEQSRLPSAALAQNAGGEIALARDAGREPIAAEPFFEVRAGIEPQPGALLYQGLTGRISFPLPAEALGLQWLRALRQVFQKRSIN
jgi:putative peptide zinc metalloprotease protein